MPKLSMPDEEFITQYERLGPSEFSRRFSMNLRAVLRKRVKLEEKHGIKIKAPPLAADRQSVQILDYGDGYPRRVPIRISDGIAMIASDAHYWPGIITPAHRALVHLIGVLNPAHIFFNGDSLDGAKISRHPPIGWTRLPTVKEEIEAVDARKDEIRKKAKGAGLHWILGNHDLRLENYIVQNASELERVKGVSLKDHFPRWNFSWSVWINNEIVIKHRFKGGIHATHNNTLWAGKTIITGHLHSLKVTPFADYNGNRFGVDTGTLAYPYGPQFAYTEDNPLNWRSGFIVLTFKDGRMLWPEVVHVLDDNHVEFRGQVIRV